MRLAVHFHRETFAQPGPDLGLNATSHDLRARSASPLEGDICISPTPSGFTPAPISAIIGMDRPTKISFADMRDMGVRGLLIYRGSIALVA